MSEIYGAPPVDLGLIDISPKEMMFWLYCPIKLPGQDQYTVPMNLKQFEPIVEAVAYDLPFKDFINNYVYITAKTLFVSADNPGNRPGWHSDGFMTDDLNYIWSDSNGTMFWEPESRVNFVQDHTLSLTEMRDAADVGPHRVYPDKRLLRLDQGVIHRVADVHAPRVRSFVKISVSRDQYDLVGNSVNHELAPNWTYHERAEERNAPAKAESKAVAA
ncbi:hypothetical protein G6K93_07560 [Agrobacterium rhizogenes]|nr:hypothetical protein [Rhizobium rhizogenes]